MSGARVPVADGATRIYGIIGDPIAQVRSPVVFNDKFRALGKNAVMNRCTQNPKRLTNACAG